MAKYSVYSCPRLSWLLVLTPSTSATGQRSAVGVNMDLLLCSASARRRMQFSSALSVGVSNLPPVGSCV